VKFPAHRAGLQCRGFLAGYYRKLYSQRIFDHLIKIQPLRFHRTLGAYFLGKTGLFMKEISDTNTPIKRKLGTWSKINNGNELKEDI